MRCDNFIRARTLPFFHAWLGPPAASAYLGVPGSCDSSEMSQHLLQRLSLAGANIDLASRCGQAHQRSKASSLNIVL